MSEEKLIRRFENEGRPAILATWLALFCVLASAGSLFAQGSSSPVSDNFDSLAFNSAVWTFVNPLNDGVLTMNGTAATLNVPHGKSHDLWITGNNSVRIMQVMQNIDFGVEVRFQSAVQLGNQDEGILVQQDNTHFIRFDLLSDGTNVRLFAAAVTGPTATTFTNSPIAAPNAPIWVRLQRSGNSWTGSWSTDGTNFTVGTTFSFALNVSQIGPYAGSSSNGDSPGFTAIVDYFFNTANRLPNQDGPNPFKTVIVDPNPPSALVEKTLANVEGIFGRLNPVAGFEAPSGGIFWYQPPPAGNSTGPWVKHTIVANGNAYEDMAPYDVNGDGAVDIIASYQAPGANTHNMVWFENPRGHGGDPAIDPWIIHAIGSGQGENNIVLADIDGDGKIDVATALFIYFQNGPDSWTQVQYNSAFRGVALLDIGSGLGSVNLVSTAPVPSYKAVWFENPREHGGNARTDSWIVHDIGPAFSCPLCPAGDMAVAAYAAAELNGDGRMDVVASQSETDPNGTAPAGGLIWYEAPADRRNGTWVRHTVDANFIDAHATKIADMDQNGTMDLVTAEQDQSVFRRVSVFYNDGHGNFTQQVVSNEEGHNVAIGGTTGNGRMDIVNSGHGFYGTFHPLVIFLNQEPRSSVAYPAVWRPENGTWYVLPTGSASNPLIQQWGLLGDFPVSGDYDGDGIVDFAVWRPSNGVWYIIPSSNPGAPVVQQWGTAGDVPLAGDFDGDGKTDFAIWRPSNGVWYIILSSSPGSPVVQPWGSAGDVPLAGDFDGDGKTDLAVWRPANGTWYIIPSSNPGSPVVQHWGLSGDIPLAGDFDGDGKTDFAVWRPSNGTWYIMPSSNPSSFIIRQWGLPGDVPASGDFDGDGKTDFAVWRSANGLWYIVPSGNPGSPVTQPWGLPGDLPVDRPPQ